MVQSVELLLDDGSEAAVRAQWRLLLEAGLPSQARHTGASNRPHVTLTARDAIPDGVEQALAAAVGPLPLPLTLGGLLLFPGRRCVLARLVVPSSRLLRAQLAVAAVLDGAGAPSSRGAHFHAGRWTPHVTLARGLTGEQVAAALALLVPESLDTRHSVQTRHSSPIAGTDTAGAAFAVRRWDGDARRGWELPVC